MSSRCIWNFAQPQSEACRARRIAKIEDEKKKGTVDKTKGRHVETLCTRTWM